VGRSNKQWKRNTAGIEQAAKARAAATAARVDAALSAMTKPRSTDVISFEAVARQAGCSTAWLYQHPEYRDRIVALRQRQQPEGRPVLPREVRASDASKDAVITVLKERLKRAEQRLKAADGRNRELERQLEVAYGYVGVGQTPPRPE
jgi:hypothetical protein